MPSLDWITIEGFKSIRLIEKLRLTNINVIIGANGSGKSNFIASFAFLHNIRNGGLQEFVKRAGGADEILHYGREGSQEIRFNLSFSGERNQYDIRLIPTATNGLVPFDETVYFWNKEYPTPYSEGIPSRDGEAGISSAQSRPIASYVRGHLDKWRLYHFHDTSSDSPLKRSSDLNDNRFLRPDGSNIASFLFMLKEKHPDNYKMIVSAIRDVAPFFDDFQLLPLILNQNKIVLEWTEVGHDKYMSSSSMSDGTIRFVALATLMLQPKEFAPSIILVDEPELGLHPYALTVLASMVRFAGQHSQVILSTQSALFLDNFEPEEVLVSDRVEGGTELKRLSSDVLNDWLNDYSLGQLWEKAEFGGRPRSSTEFRS